MRLHGNKAGIFLFILQQVDHVAFTLILKIHMQLSLEFGAQQGYALKGATGILA